MSYLETKKFCLKSCQKPICASGFGGLLLSDRFVTKLLATLIISYDTRFGLQLLLVSYNSKQGVLFKIQPREVQPETNGENTFRQPLKKQCCSLLWPVADRETVTLLHYLSQVKIKTISISIVTYILIYKKVTSRLFNFKKRKISILATLWPFFPNFDKRNRFLR